MYIRSRLIPAKADDHEQQETWDGGLGLWIWDATRRKVMFFDLKFAFDLHRTVLIVYLSQ